MFLKGTYTYKLMYVSGYFISLFSQNNGEQHKVELKITMITRYLFEALRLFLKGTYTYKMMYVSGYFISLFSRINEGHQ